MDVALGTVIGFIVWFIFIVVGAMICVWLIPNKAHHAIIIDIMTLLSMLIGLLSGVFSVRLMVATRVRQWKYERQIALGSGVCPICGYRLRGLPEPRCPKCGERFTEAEFSQSTVE